MPFSVKIIADSISSEDSRLTTMELMYPRFIHSEFMTHRVLSRNSSSSRAIPVNRMLEEIRQNPAMPIYWGSNQPGMQAGKEVENVEHARLLWLEAMESAVRHAERMNAQGLHKQIVNRLLEPFAHIRVVVTATEWKNFFALRCHPDAQPEIQVLAEMMEHEYWTNIPNLLKIGDWHLPYITEEDVREAKDLDNNPEWAADPLMDFLIPISVARCARVSYKTHEGKPTTLDADLALYERLVKASPPHMSPAEHQATPDKVVTPEAEGMHDLYWHSRDLHGNFTGWKQFRKILEQKETI